MIPNWAYWVLLVVILGITYFVWLALFVIHPRHEKIRDQVYEAVSNLYPNATAISVLDYIKQFYPKKHIPLVSVYYAFEVLEDAGEIASYKKEGSRKLYWRIIAGRGG